MANGQHDKVSELNSCNSINTEITQIKVEKFEYTWMINNFICSDFSKEYTSSKFKVGNCYYLLNLRTDIFPNFYSIFSSVCVTSKDTVPARLIEICLLNSDGEEAVRKSMLFDESNQEIAAEPFLKFITRDHVFNMKNKLLKNGVLTIVCRIYFHKATVNCPGPIKPDLKEMLPQRLGQLDNYERLLMDDKYSDLKLIVAGHEFPVHKCILAAQSRYFAAMFEHGKRELSDNEVEIIDMKPEVMQEILRFIYVGKVNDIEKLARDLLVAADKYQLQELITMCQDALVEHLSLENIVEVLENLDNYNSKNLREAAIKFVTENSRVLTDMDKFRKLFKSVSWNLMMEISEAVTKKE